MIKFFASKGRPAVAMLLAFAGLSLAWPQDEKVVVRDLKLTDPDFDDISRVLGIEKIGGTYSLDGSITTIGIALEVQERGKKEPDLFGGPQLRSKVPGARKGRFTIQIVDLDYLKLGDGPKGHCRVYVSLAETGTTSAARFDVAKSLFDFTSTRGGGSSSVRHPDNGRIPLFWKDPGKANPNAGKLFAYLEIK